MFGLNQRKQNEKKNTAAQVIFAIGDMHCSSCALNIDGALEEIEGVISASTNYAKAYTKIEYDPEKVTLEQLQKVINDMGHHSLA